MDHSTVITGVPEKRLYDLEERTARFSERVIDFCKLLPRNDISRPLIDQIIRSATSVSANYCEVNDASSKRDFLSKLAIVKKESKETMLWLRLIGHAMPDKKVAAQDLWQEAHELNLIFATIIRKTRLNAGL